MYINDASPVIRNCRFAGNQGAVGGSSMFSGGAVSIKLDCEAIFENCTFENNISYTNGGGIAAFSETRIINCLFNADSAEVWGGGVFLSSSYLTSPITNCTFMNNNSQKGTALGTHNHEAVTRNCIFWHDNPTNPNSFIFLDSQFNWNLLNIAYCDIRNGENGIEDGGTTQYTYGPGNIESDPALSPETGVPGWQSPCIEAGTPDTSGLFLPEQDLHGNYRIINERIDMGAFEYQLSLIVQSSKFKVQSELNICPNPAKDQVFISFPDFSNNKSKEIIIYNSIGTPVKTIDTRDGVPVISTDIGELPAGLYFVELIIDGKKMRVEKLVVVN
jgi:predicted outer membrane repeat protein